MKIIIINIILVMSLLNTASSLDDYREHLTPEFQFFQNSSTIGLHPFSADYFKQTDMLIGFWWGGDLRLTDNLNSNMMQTSIGINKGYSSFNGLLDPIHSLNYTISNNNNKKINLITQFDGFYPFEAQSFQYEPTLNLPAINGEPSDNFTSQVLASGDSSRPIWGFQTRSGNIEQQTLIDISGKPFLKNFLTIETASNTSVSVLSNPWPNKWLVRRELVKNLGNRHAVTKKKMDDFQEIYDIYLDALSKAQSDPSYKNTQEYKKANEDFTKTKDEIIRNIADETMLSCGLFWFVSINLKIDVLPENPQPDDVILRIKMPYYLFDQAQLHDNNSSTTSSDYITFVDLFNEEQNPYANNIRFTKNWIDNSSTNVYDHFTKNEVFKDWFDGTITNNIQTINTDYIDYSSFNSNDFNQLEWDYPTKGRKKDFRDYQIFYRPNKETKEIVIQYKDIQHIPKGKTFTYTAFFFCMRRNDYDNEEIFKDEADKYSGANFLPRMDASLYDPADDIQKKDFYKFGLDVYPSDKFVSKVDWLRIENPLAYSLFRGDNDLALTWMVQRYINYIEKDYVCDDNSGGHWTFQNYNNYKLFRLYASNGHDATRLWAWNSLQYLSRMFPGMLVLSTGSDLNDRFNYHILPANKWIIEPAVKGSIANPIYKTINNSNQTLNHEELFQFYNSHSRSGFWKSNITGHGTTDFIRNSGYETWLVAPVYYSSGTLVGQLDYLQGNSLNDPNYIQKLRNEIININDYKDVLRASRSFQSQMEFGNWTGFYGNWFENNNDKFLYSNIPWWAQIFTMSQWSNLNNKETNNSWRFSLSYHWPLTGEELRMQCFSGLLKGAKGLVYDREVSVRAIPIQNQDFIIKALAEPNINVSGWWDYMVWTSGGNPPVRPTIENYYLSNLSKNSFSKYYFLKQDQLGTDWLNGAGNDDLLIDINNSNFYNKTIGDFATYLGTSNDRIYIGTKSKRIETRKVHDWAVDNEQILMKLKLISWYWKGYRIWQSSKPGMTNTFNSIVKLPNKSDNIESLIPLKVRPIDREKIISRTPDGEPTFAPYYEPPDSTFYDITLLGEEGIGAEYTEDSDGGNTPDMKPLSRVFYIGVLNKRTDPIIIDNNIDKFYTSAEFDEGIVIGDINNTADWYRNMWWKRLGCREISIPLNINSTDPTKYKLVKVTELTRSEQSYTDQFKAYNSSISPAEISSLRESLYPKVQTIIGQDGYITAKYLAGEGKLFKCEVIDVDENLNGNLAHSNQCKLISYPVLNPQGNETGSIQYHLVYFKDIVENSITKTKVFYNRSLPIDEKTTNPQITWEDQTGGRVVSDNFTDLNTQTIISVIHCDYPSIVVRKNASKLTVYVAYTCEGDAADPTTRVNVALFDVTGNNYSPKSLSSISITPPLNKQIASIPDINREEWGNPVINASYSGNFYAWSSPGTLIPPTVSQIKVAFGLPGAIPSLLFPISPPQFSDWSLPNITTMKHPSFNVYSNILNNENECSLVWQAKYQDPNSNDLYSKVLLTKLKYSTQNNTIVYSTPSNKSLSIPKYCSVNIGSNAGQILMLNHQWFTNSTFPVVYTQNTGAKIDYVYFQNEMSIGNGSYLSGYNFLTFPRVNSISLGISHVEDIATNNSSSTISQPNISQPAGLLNDGILEKPAGKWILNMQIDGSIYQYLGSGNTDAQFFSTNNNDFRHIAYFADQSHLSASQSTNISYPWKNRRVFNDANKKILATATYFYAINNLDVSGEHQIGYISDTASLLINLPYITNKRILINKPVSKIYDSNDSVFVIIPKDTLYSNWFTISTDTMDIKVSGIDTAAKIILQYEDNYLLPLTLPAIMKTDTGHYLRYCFINGEGMNFRLLIVKSDTMAKFMEKTVLGGVACLDTFYYNINLFRQMANDVPENPTLNRVINLDLKPNPANDELFVTVSSRNIITDGETKPFYLRLYSIKGDDLIKLEVGEGTTKIPIKDLPQGLYYIRAESISSKTLEKLYPVIKSFVIER